jgi:hypothetical protein
MWFRRTLTQNAKSSPVKSVRLRLDTLEGREVPSVSGGNENPPPAGPPAAPAVVTELYAVEVVDAQMDASVGLFLLFQVTGNQLATVLYEMNSQQFYTGTASNTIVSRTMDVDTQTFFTAASSARAAGTPLPGGMMALPASSPTFDELLQYGVNPQLPPPSPPVLPPVPPTQPPIVFPPVTPPPVTTPPTYPPPGTTPPGGPTDGPYPPGSPPPIKPGIKKLDGTIKDGKLNIKALEILLPPIWK